MPTLSELARHSQLRLGAALRARVAGDDATERAAGSGAARASAGSRPTTRSGGCTPTPRCSPAASPPCCCSRCTRWRWPASRAQRLQGRPVGPAAAHQPLPRDDHLRHRRGRRGGRSSRCAVIHERVRGTDPHGRPYRATTRTCCAGCTWPRRHSFLAAYQRYARRAADGRRGRPLRRAVSLVAAAGSAPPTCRPRCAELDAASTAYRPELEATAAAREAARFLLLNPPLPLAARPGYGLIASGGVALLPALGAPRRCGCPRAGR